MTLTKPNHNSHRWAALPREVRDEVNLWFTALERYSCLPSKRERDQQISTFLGLGLSTVRNKLTALKNGGGHWSALVDKRKLKKAEEEVRTNSPRFVDYLSKLVEEMDRSNRQAFRELRARWVRGEEIPGYEDQPGHPKIPAGWSDSNLYDLLERHKQARKDILQSIRIGTSSKGGGKLLPQLHMTRTQLYPGAVYHFDDMRHDNFVTYGKSKQPARVDEVGVLDRFSGCRFAWGNQPRRRRAPQPGKRLGSEIGLKEHHTRLLAISALYKFGYSDRGTVLQAENGTAAITEWFEELLYNASGGLIRVERNPIENASLFGGTWAGTDGGNFRANAHLESLHNLIHNGLAAIPMQVGKDAKHRNPDTDRILNYHVRTFQKLIEARPERAELFASKIWDFHAHFRPYVDEYYRHHLNGRRDHNLEGWEALGFIETLFRTAPGVEPLSRAEFLSIAKSDQQLANNIEGLALARPDDYLVRQVKSPNEVFQPAVRALLRLNPATITDMIEREAENRNIAKELKVSRGEFHFRDLEVAPDELHYSADQAQTIDGHSLQLRHGDKCLCYPLPFTPEAMFLCDSKGRFLGIAPLLRKINPFADIAASASKSYENRETVLSHDLRKGMGEKRARIAEILEPARNRHSEGTRSDLAIQSHNKRLLESDQPQTEGEKKAAREQREITRAGRALQAEEVGSEETVIEVTNYEDQASEEFSPVVYDDYETTETETTETPTIDY